MIENGTLKSAAFPIKNHDEGQQQQHEQRTPHLSLKAGKFQSIYQKHSGKEILQIDFVNFIRAI